MQRVVSATNAANLAAQSIAARDTLFGVLGSSDMARIIPKPDAFRPATRGGALAVARLVVGIEAVPGSVGF